MNLADVAGMAPTEARLFTLEARQRTEENNNIKRCQTLQEEIETLKEQIGECIRRKEKVTKEIVLPVEIGVSGLGKGLIGRKPEDVKPRSVSPLTRQPFSSSYVRGPLRRQTDRVEVWGVGQRSPLSSPLTPPLTMSRLTDHETVKFERLIDKTS